MLNTPLSISHESRGTLLLDANGGLVASLEAGNQDARDKHARDIVAAVNGYSDMRKALESMIEIGSKAVSQSHQPVIEHAGPSIMAISVSAVIDGVQEGHVVFASRGHMLRETMVKAVRTAARILSGRIVPVGEQGPLVPSRKYHPELVRLEAMISMADNPADVQIANTYANEDGGNDITVAIAVTTL